MPTKKRKSPTKKKRSKGMAKKSTGRTTGTVVSLLRPRKTEAIITIAQDWLDGKTPNLNVGLYSKADHEVLLKGRKAARDQGKKLPPIPYLYSPVIVQIARKMKAGFAVQGQAEKQPKPPSDWPTSKVGTHEPGMKIDSFRMNHADDVKKLIDDVEENVVTVGSREYVVGTTDTSAVFVVNSARSGNYKYNISVAKRLSLDGIKELANLVGQIGNRLWMQKFEDGGENVWLPSQDIIWGYLEKGGKQLTPAAVRKLDAKEKGIKFVPLKNPIVGRGVTKEECLKEVKREMSLAGTKDDTDKTAWQRFEARKKSKGTEAEDCGWTNLTSHQTRINPIAANCLGFRNVQLAIPPFTEKGDDGSILVKFAVGCRLTVDLVTEKKTTTSRVSSKKTGTKKTSTTTTKKAKGKTAQVTTEKPVVTSEETVPLEPEPVISAEFADDYDDEQELIDIDEMQREEAEADMRLAADLS